MPERHGIKQSVGDTVGPGGISRALRNIPVMVGIARDMEEVCPDAWLLNITNPMTTLCRAVTRETEIATVGLCHEVTMAQFTLSQLLDADFRAFDLTVTGVNHLPVVTAMKVGGDDGFELPARAARGCRPARRRTGPPARRARPRAAQLRRPVQEARPARVEPGEVLAVRTLRRAARRG